MKYDIKCDNCGRFIKSEELTEGGGATSVFIPDSDVSYEECYWRCKSCTEKHGKVLSKQFGHLELVK